MLEDEISSELELSYSSSVLDEEGSSELELFSIELLELAMELELLCSMLEDETFELEEEDWELAPALLSGDIGSKLPEHDNKIAMRHAKMTYL